MEKNYFFNIVFEEKISHSEEKCSYPLNEFIIYKYFNKMKEFKSNSVNVEITDCSLKSESFNDRVHNTQNNAEDLSSINSPTSVIKKTTHFSINNIQS